MPDRRYYTYYLPSVAAVAAVVILSVAPIGLPEVFRRMSLADKWTHFLMYAVMTLVLCADQHINRRNIAWTLTAVCGCALGIALEFVQYYLPYRSYDPLDMIANVVGIILGIIIAAAISLIFRHLTR